MPGEVTKGHAAFNSPNGDRPRRLPSAALLGTGSFLLSVPLI